MPIWLGKIIAKRIIKWIKHRIDLKKIDNYVNKPNELDKEVKGIKKDIKKLQKNSHPRADWVCLECGCEAKKKATPARRRKRKRKLNKEK